MIHTCLQTSLTSTSKWYLHISSYKLTNHGRHETNIFLCVVFSLSMYIVAQIECPLLETLLNLWMWLWIWQWIQQTATKLQKIARRKKSWRLPRIEPETSWFEGEYSNHYTTTDSYIILSKIIALKCQKKKHSKNIVLLWPCGHKDQSFLAFWYKSKQDILIQRSINTDE